VLQKEVIFQISNHKSPLSICKRVSREILNKFYAKYINYLNYKWEKIVKRNWKSVTKKWYLL